MNRFCKINLKLRSGHFASLCSKHPDPKSKFISQNLFISNKLSETTGRIYTIIFILYINIKTQRGILIPTIFERFMILFKEVYKVFDSILK